MSALVQTLYLVPAPLSQEQPSTDLLPADLETVRSVRTWLVETPKVARAWLKLYGHPGPLSDLNIQAIAELTASNQLSAFLQSAQGAVGVMSDAGCPGVADPGAEAVACAHVLGWHVQPMVGPSSILLALMASGLSGQRFTFHGYLPVEDAQRAQWIAQSQRSSASLQQSQIAIETPYRNQALFKALCEHLDGQTVLCIASEIRGPKQTISSRTIDQWRRLAPVLDKQATLFLWQAQAISAGGKSRSEQPPFLRQSSRRRV